MILEIQDTITQIIINASIVGMFVGLMFAFFKY